MINTRVDFRFALYFNQQHKCLYYFRVTVCIDDPNGSDATIYYKPDVYTEVANCSLGSCPMKDRDTWLDEIPLTSDQVLVSDIYVVRNGPLRTSSEVDIDFTFTPMSSTKNKNIKVIAKQDGEWTEVEAVKEVIKTLFLHLFFRLCVVFVHFENFSFIWKHQQCRRKLDHATEVSCEDDILS